MNKRKINESLLRDKSKKQMSELNRIIKKSGGDIQDRVKKGENKKEDKMPNTFYMDNPFDSNRSSIESQEHFTKHGAHYKSTAMLSKEQHKNEIEKMNKKNTIPSISERKKSDIKDELEKEEELSNYMNDVSRYISNNVIGEIDEDMLSFTLDKYTSKIRRCLNRNDSCEECGEILLKDKNFLSNILVNEDDLSMNESKKSKKSDIPVSETKPFKPLKNLKHFYEFVDVDSKGHVPSDVKDDSWIKGNSDDFKRPMFVNLPDKETRTPYDVLRSGTWIDVFGTQGRIIGIKDDLVWIDVMNEESKKHQIVKYNLPDVVKELDEKKIDKKIKQIKQTKKNKK